MGIFSKKLFGLIGLLVFASCRPSPSTSPGVGKTDDEGAQLQMKPIEVASYGQQGLEWVLNAPTAQGYTLKNLIFAKDIKIKLYETGEESTTILADESAINAKMTQKDGVPGGRTEFKGITLDPGDMYMAGNVVVVSTDGTRMTTDWLHYQQQSGLINSTAPVRVERTDSVTEGTGFQATSDLTKLEIFKQTLTIKDEK